MYIVNVDENFIQLWKNRCTGFDIDSIKNLECGFHLVSFKKEPYKNRIKDTIFCRYIFPVEYQWPTKISEQGFIEKCAQGLKKKFDKSLFKNIIVFSFDRKQKQLASNVRGRLCQVFESTLVKHTNKETFSKWTKEPQSQPRNHKVLVVGISQSCVYAGITTPADAGSSFGGGRMFVSVSHEAAISRAASKCVEALEYLKLNNIHTGLNQKWLELGAAPGGITQELVRRGNEVWAVDKTDLDPELKKNPKIHFHMVDARAFKASVIFDNVFCDMNGPALIAAQTCALNTTHLKKSGLVLFTYKIHDLNLFEDEYKKILKVFEEKKLKHIYSRHLYNNKSEVTLIFSKTEPAHKPRAEQSELEPKFKPSFTKSAPSPQHKPTGTRPIKPSTPTTSAHKKNARTPSRSYVRK